MNAGTGRPYYQEESRENAPAFVDLDQSTKINSRSPNSIISKSSTNDPHLNTNCYKTPPSDNDTTRLETTTKTKSKKRKHEPSLSPEVLHNASFPMLPNDGQPQTPQKPLHPKLAGVIAMLEMKELWDEFDHHHNEMIVTKAGR